MSVKNGIIATIIAYLVGAVLWFFISAMTGTLLPRRRAR